MMALMMLTMTTIMMMTTMTMTMTMIKKTRPLSGSANILTGSVRTLAVGKGASMTAAKPRTPIGTGKYSKSTQVYPSTGYKFQTVLKSADKYIKVLGYYVPVPRGSEKY